MKYSRGLKQFKMCFFKYFTERAWKMGEKSSREKFERAALEELIQLNFKWSYSLSLGNTRKILARRMDPKLFNVKPRANPHLMSVIVAALCLDILTSCITVFLDWEGKRKHIQ